MEPSFLEKLETLSSGLDDLNEAAFRKELKHLDEEINEKGVQLLLRDNQELIRAHRILSDLPERIRGRFGKDLAEVVHRAAEKIMPVPTLPEETWGEIFARAESKDLGRLRTDRMTSKLSEAEKRKRVEGGELSVRVYGCTSAKEAIATIKERQLSRADLSSFDVEPEDLKELIRECPHVRALILPLTEVPAEIGNLTQLEELTLKTGGPIPKEIGNLSRLKTFNLNSLYTLELLPKEFAQLQNLKTVVLNSAYHHQVPGEIYQLKQLETLVLRNRVALSPEIQNLTNLKVLALEHLEGNLPEEIGTLQQLRSLSLVGRLRDLPESIGNLSNLNVLDVSRSLVRTLPDSVGNLETLKILKINFNPYLQGSEILDRLKGLEQIEFLGRGLTREQLKAEGVEKEGSKETLVNTVLELTQRGWELFPEESPMRMVIEQVKGMDFSIMSREELMDIASAAILWTQINLNPVPDDVWRILCRISNNLDLLK